MPMLRDFGFPLVVLSGSCVAAVITAASSLVRLDFSAFTSFRAFQDRWYANVWKVLGDLSFKGARPHVEPLIPQATGVVLDIGTGTGHLLYLYDPKKVTKIYAVEPNEGQHDVLLQRAKAAGLEDVFELVAEPVGNLEKRGIVRGTVDCVVTIKVLCCIPDPELVINDLYTYLKPGGCWIVFEHVRTSTKGITPIYQAFLNSFWPFFSDGCNMRRDTANTIKNSGAWNSSTLGPVPNESSTTIVPHVCGILRK